MKIRNLGQFIAVGILTCSTFAFAADTRSEQTKKLPAYCPAPSTVVQLSKAMNDSFITDYKDCDIVVEATFYKMGDDGMVVRYNKKANTVFQILDPGGTPQTQLGVTFGTFASLPKTKSDVVFQLKQGDAIILRGAPVRLTSFGQTLYPVFQADSVSKK